MRKILTVAIREYVAAVKTKAFIITLVVMPIIGALTTYNGGSDVFVAKLNASGSELPYATFLGGSGAEAKWGGSAIALDGSGAAYVTGETESTDFPTTTGAYDTSHNGDLDVFVAKLAMGAACTDEMQSSHPAPCFRMSGISCRARSQ